MRSLQKKPEDFEKFYHRYVGKGEACGCAERIIDVNEFNRLAGPRVRGIGKQRGAIARWTASLFRLLPDRG